LIHVNATRLAIAFKARVLALAIRSATGRFTSDSKCIEFDIFSDGFSVSTVGEMRV